METSITSQQQQTIAKLNLLCIDDDHFGHEEQSLNEDSQQWGRSVQTRTFLKEKLSQRYKLKRQSQQQSRIKSTARKALSKKVPMPSDKESLKELLKKLDSKEIKTTKQQTLRNTMVSETGRFSLQNNIRQRFNSDRTTIDHQNTEDGSFRKSMKQSIENVQNNFISKKIDVKLYKKNPKLNNEALLSIENTFLEPYIDDMTRKREFFTQCKHTRMYKKTLVKHNENKENEVVGFMENPLYLFKSGQKMKKAIMISQHSRGKESLLQRQQINKKTFQILQQINRTKSINTGKKLVSQSLKLKKCQMGPYSQILKERGNEMERLNRPKSNVVIRNSSDSIWVKLEIRR